MQGRSGFFSFIITFKLQVSKFKFQEEMANETILRFDGVSFDYGHTKKILDEVDFSIRRGSKITIMGQNGAGKSTIFQLMTGALTPESGRVNLGQNVTIAMSKQVIPVDRLDLTVREFF